MSLRTGVNWLTLVFAQCLEKLWHGECLLFSWRSCGGIQNLNRKKRFLQFLSIYTVYTYMNSPQKKTPNKKQQTLRLRRFHRRMSWSPWFPGPRCRPWRRCRRQRSDHRRRASPSAWHDTWHRCTWWWDISMQGEPWTTACNLLKVGSGRLSYIFLTFFFVERGCWTCWTCCWKVEMERQVLDLRTSWTFCVGSSSTCLGSVRDFLYGWVWCRTQYNLQVLPIEGL